MRRGTATRLWALWLACRRVYICIAAHGLYTKTSEGLLRIVNLVQSPCIVVNWDTGNSHIAGAEDHYEGLARVRDHVRHVHAKDTDLLQSERERGTVTGSPVGCASGEGVVDFKRVLEILDPVDRDVYLSEECGTVEQAAVSLPYLESVVGDRTF